MTRITSMCVSLIDTIAANVDNDGLTDAQFRQFVRNSLPTTVEKEIVPVYNKRFGNETQDQEVSLQICDHFRKRIPGR